MKIFGNKSAVSCWCIICSRCCLLALVEPPKSQWFIIFQMNTARLPGLASSHHLWWWLETWSSSPRILGCFGTRHDRFLTILGSTPWKSQEHVCVYIHIYVYIYIYMYRGFLSQQIPDSNSQIGEFAILNWTAPMALGPFGQHFPVNAKAHAVDFDCGPLRVDLEIALDLYVYMYIYYMYIYICMVLYIYKLFTFTYIYIYTQYIYIYISIYIHIHVYTHKHRHACIFLLWICRCTWASP